MLSPGVSSGPVDRTRLAARPCPWEAARLAGLTDPGSVGREWAAAVAGTGYLPMPRAELEALLTGLAGELVTQLDRHPEDPRPALHVGDALVAAHVASAEGLGRSIQVLTDWLTGPGRAATDPDRPARVARLLGAVAAGFAQALRDRTLAEQEAIRRAALLARCQSERALRESEARFRYQATHDPLTRLANRALFTERLAELFARGTGNAPLPRRIGVCFIDLDGFKAVNDTLGHYIGDLLLAEVGDRLRRHLPGRLVARLGGDEFVILLEDTTCTDQAIKVADAALAAVSAPICVDGHELSISASIGIVERELGMTCPSEMVRAADITLQCAKAEGKGRWAVFDRARSERELARFELSAALPVAVDRGELFLEYQPVVDLRSGAVLAVEALVRWHHPRLGVLGPDRFLGLAAETGLIVRLGGWVLAEACRQARHWDRWSPEPPMISVDVTARQTQDPGLVDTVTTALERSGLAPHRLQLEITEGTALDVEPVRALHRLAELGVRLAVDDFGTGHCDLTSLRRLPVREVKISGELLTGLAARDGGDPVTTTDGRVVGTLVSLAHTLDLTATAGGVETSGQAAALRALGCDAAQGGRFGHPVPADRLRLG
jgi:diguanylate cyclase (GGDEF)-like protein